MDYCVLEPNWSHGSDILQSKLLFADAYRRSAQSLFTKPSNIYHYSGPVLQLTGLAIELSLKCVLEGRGSKVPNIHCTAKLLRLAESSLNVGALNREVELRCDAENVDFAFECAILDKLYDRPYRSRYLISGASKLPKFEVLTTGSNILLLAMAERAS